MADHVSLFLDGSLYKLSMSMQLSEKEKRVLAQCKTFQCVLYRYSASSILINAAQGMECSDCGLLSISLSRGASF
jgi:hypothetical protein